MKRSSFFLMIGSGLITASIFLLFLIFYPVVKEEVGYNLTVRSGQIPQVSTSQNPSDDSMTPLDMEFGIVIPKIRANAKVMADVDPFDSVAYQRALTRGVAHAKNTAYPGEPGNTFIFSHSSVDFYLASRYNSVFYLLNKLEHGDDIYLTYKQQLYHYQLTEKKLVDPKEVSYLTGKNNAQSLTLMTCWPPGTTHKRLIVQADLME